MGSFGVNPVAGFYQFLVLESFSKGLSLRALLVVISLTVRPGPQDNRAANHMLGDQYARSNK